jgi:hypothetical protein
MARRVGWTILGLFAALALPHPAQAGCGCEKPPPVRRTVQPPVSYPGGWITIFDSRLISGQRYRVQFTSTVQGTSDATWSGFPKSWRDLADGTSRHSDTQPMYPPVAGVPAKLALRVQVGRLPFGPATVSVWKFEDYPRKTPLFTVGDDQFTVTAKPLQLMAKGLVSNKTYHAGVGRDGTLYIPLYLDGIEDATAFVGKATGFNLPNLQAGDIKFYNDQGFTMQVLPKADEGTLFSVSSNQLSYWRHDFHAYYAAHQGDNGLYMANSDAGNWHADHTYHIDHNHIIVAIHPSMGPPLTPGTTKNFQVTITSKPSPGLGL